jgi:hypothetical protein
MPTTVTSSIGTASRDYSTLQAWEDACPANLVTDDKIWLGEAYNDSEFTSAGTVLTMAGVTTDATRYIHLACAAGQSFSDHANVRTNPLFYDASKGVGIRTTAAGYNNCVLVETVDVRITGVQVDAPDGTGSSGLVAGLSSQFILSKSLVRAREPITKALTTASQLHVNCVFIMRGNGSMVGTGFGSQRFEYCTFVQPAAAPTGTGGSISYGTLTVENCTIFGLSTGFSGGSLAGGYNATDLASAPGSNNQVSKTYANQFVSTTNDFRAATSGSDLVNGTPATGYATDDISYFARSATVPTIGAWELAAADPSAMVRVMFNKLRPRIFAPGLAR